MGPCAVDYEFALFFPPESTVSFSTTPYASATLLNRDKSHLLQISLKEKSRWK